MMIAKKSLRGGGHSIHAGPADNFGVDLPVYQIGNEKPVALWRSRASRERFAFCS